MKTLFTVLVVLTLTACGGEGGGSDQSSQPEAPVSGVPSQQPAQLKGYYRDVSPTRASTNVNCRTIPLPASNDGYPSDLIIQNQTLSTSFATFRFTYLNLTGYMVQTSDPSPLMVPIYLSAVSDDKTEFTVTYSTGCRRFYKLDTSVPY